MYKYIQHIERKRLSKNTIKTYISSLRLMNAESNDWRIVKKNLFNINFSSNTVHLHKNVLKNYFQFTKNKKMLNHLDFIKMPQIEVKYYEVISKNKIYKKTNINFGDSEKIKKWKTIIKFLFETGIRANELNNMTIINKKLYVLGKGNKRRQIFYIIETFNTLIKYMPFLQHKETSKTLRIYVKKILGKNITPHSLRRSFATHMLNNGCNPKSLMLQMGHTKIETTFRYLNLSEKYNKNNYLKIMKK